MNDDIPLPQSVADARRLDATVGQAVQHDFERVLLTTEAMHWALGHLPALAAAPDSAAFLTVLRDVARDLTGAPEVWAVAWSGTPERPSFRALVADAGTEVPAPSELSQTLVGEVARTGRPTWSDDATADARFQSAESVHAFALRSVGALPIGKEAVLVLQDRSRPGRFGRRDRARLSALCRLASLLPEPGAPVEPASPVEPIEGLVGDAPAIQKLVRQIRSFAPVPWPALILGETGVGKELVARAMHALSPNADRPFVAINCGAIPETLAESTLFGHERGAFTGADRMQEGVVGRVGGGTLFLDEVGELPAPVQAKLLRLLQERVYERVGGQRELPFRGRVLAATLRDLQGPQRDGFRTDLYHRLAACVIHVPSLRDRRTDIPMLATHLLQRALEQVGVPEAIELDPSTLSTLVSRDWPGNVRELENALRSGLAQAMAEGSERLLPRHLTSERAAVQVRDLPSATEDFQRRLIDAALQAHDGNRTRAAEALGVSRQWLHRLLKRWEVA
jgi:transcriptional regulator with AAA-type ATPase domain